MRRNLPAEIATTRSGRLDRQGLSKTPHADCRSSLAHLLARSGYDTGVDVDQIIEWSPWLEEISRHPVASPVGKAGLFGGISPK